MNHTLVQAVRSMMIHANLPHKFWAETLQTTVYIINWSSSKEVNGKTQYERKTQRQSLEDLCVHSLRMCIE